MKGTPWRVTRWWQKNLYSISGQSWERGLVWHGGWARGQAELETQATSCRKRRRQIRKEIQGVQILNRNFFSVEITFLKKVPRFSNSLNKNHKNTGVQILKRKIIISFFRLKLHLRKLFGELKIWKKSHEHSVCSWICYALKTY